MNDLISTDLIKQPKEIVKQLSPSECITIVDMFSIMSKDFISAAREKIFNSNVENFRYTLPSGEVRLINIQRGRITTSNVEIKTFNYDKAIQFAKEHNLKLPMTPRVVIEPMVDKTKLEDMDWFQEHIDEFKETKTEIKTTKSTDKIVGKYA